VNGYVCLVNTTFTLLQGTAAGEGWRH